MKVPCALNPEHDVDVRHGYQRVIGWEHKGPKDSSRRGGSDIVARETLSVWACAVCVDKLRNGVAPEQEQLL